MPGPRPKTVVQKRARHNEQPDDDERAIEGIISPNYTFASPPLATVSVPDSGRGLPVLHPMATDCLKSQPCQPLASARAH